MGKRSSFERRERDFYPTPRAAVVPLLPFLKGHETYCEPCVGDGALLKALPLRCINAFDIEPDGDFRIKDALQIDEQDVDGCDLIITNPPWERTLLHEMIRRFSALRPTWLLFDADWAHTRQAAELMKLCSDVVSIGRLKWIMGSPHTGKDNCCWYRFGNDTAATIFHAR